MAGSLLLLFSGEISMAMDWRTADRESTGIAPTSISGLIGLLVSKVEGVEINFLGLVSGINPLEPAIKLP